MLLPHHVHERGAQYRLQAMDRSGLGSPLLYLASGHADQRTMVHHDLRLAPDEWLGGGTFRNSFFVEPWARLTRVRDLSLVVDASGSLRVRVMQAAMGQPAQLVKEQNFVAPGRSRMVVPLGSPLDFPAGSRLFWHMDAVDGGQLHEAAWCTRTEPGPTPQGPRMAVLMRTYGRTDDVQALLMRLADSASQDAFHAEVLSRMHFWVLDTTPGNIPGWAAMERLGLNLQVWNGPNLGGGGNAAALAQLFLDESDRAGDTAEEVLILDDDLSISMETLARYYGFCSYRDRDLICSLPVLMKSRPTIVWEDGGQWGRDGLAGPGAADPALPRRGFGPHLNRHGLSLDGYERLDEFGALNPCEYSTFIFFGLPTRALRKLGLPAAMFLRGDDIEFSLRAATLGLPIYTNPNLAAWHEPGHSYAQEHMAVLHGVLINLAYSSNTAQDYAAFFEQRMVEHAALDDLEGLRLYLGILEELLNADSAVLTPAFTTHYRQALQRLNGIALAPLPDGERERLARPAPAEASGPLQPRRPTLLPFIYPGYHPRSLGTALPAQPAPPPTVLHNPGARTARTLGTVPPQERLALQARYIAALLHWHEAFPRLSTLWKARLHASGQPGFWREVLARHPGELARTLNVQGRVSTGEPEGITQVVTPHPAHVAAPAPAQPLRELRDRLEAEIARWTRMRLSAERNQRLASTGRQAHQRSWWHGLIQRPARGLPPDFDPATYLALNADVASSGADPAQHYLRYGRREGRRYQL